MNVNLDERCNQEELDNLIGRTLDATLEIELKTRCTELRVIESNQMMIHNYMAKRLNIYVDAEKVIIKANYK